MKNIFFLMEKMAASDSSILIWGEKGTGKELIARAIHRISKRANYNFVSVNPGVSARGLFESELFGYSQEEFTGELKSDKGLLEEADKGTLFLDDVGELPLSIQAKLLTALQEGGFFKPGSTGEKKIDVRILAATRKNLHQEMRQGRFRQDLFYRLNMNSVHIPPLRERQGDIPLLAHHFLRKFCEIKNKNIQGISDAAMTVLENYDYPGNIRELMNILNSAVIIETTGEIRKNCLPSYMLENGVPPERSGDHLFRTLAEMERDHIATVLEAMQGNKTRAAHILGISRIGLLSKIKKYNLE